MDEFITFLILVMFFGGGAWMIWLKKKSPR